MLTPPLHGGSEVLRLCGKISCSQLRTQNFTRKTKPPKHLCHQASFSTTIHETHCSESVRTETDGEVCLNCERKNTVRALAHFYTCEWNHKHTFLLCGMRGFTHTSPMTNIGAPVIPCSLLAKVPGTYTTFSARHELLVLDILSTVTRMLASLNLRRAITLQCHAGSPLFCVCVCVRERETERERERGESARLTPVRTTAHRLQWPSLPRE